MIRCTTIGIEPSHQCYEICILAYRGGALNAWEKEQKRKKDENLLRNDNRSRRSGQ